MTEENMPITMPPINKYCVFSTATDAYVPKSVVSLIAFKKHNKNYDAFILCTALSEENKNLCQYCGITAIELDLSAIFYKEWDYARECYYHFKAPELFLPMGYTHSVYIDGDTYCNNKFNFDPEENFHIAGTSYDTSKELFTEIGEYEKVLQCLEITDETGFQKQRIQSGVIVYNNKRLSDFDYFNKVGELYDRSIKKGAPRKGDDSLLSLMISLYPEITISLLSQYHNLIDFKAAGIKNKLEDEDVISNCVIYHLVEQKPWFPLKEYFNYPHKYFAQKWLEVMINNFAQDDIKRCFPDIYQEDILDSEEINFYWFSVHPPNFGDWITPYFMQKICHQEIKKPVEPSETEKTVIISTGSIMRLCGPNTIVWGSGIRDRFQDIKPGKLIRSVRGPITRARVLEIGGECPPIYGDPALLLSHFYKPKEIKKNYSLGIIPHISQYDKVYQLYKDEGMDEALVIDLRTKDIERIIDKILMCEKIVSSSLHGIIVANAYNIPVRWIQFDTNIFGDNTKFHDHFESIGRKGEKFIDALFYKKIPVADLLRQIHPYVVNIDLDRLYDSSIFHDGAISKYIRYALTDQKEKLSAHRDHDQV